MRRWNVILNHGVGSSDHLFDNHFLVVVDVEAGLAGFGNELLPIDSVPTIVIPHSAIFIGARPRRDAPDDTRNRP